MRETEGEEEEEEEAESDLCGPAGNLQLGRRVIGFLHQIFIL